MNLVYIVEATYEDSMMDCSIQHKCNFIGQFHAMHVVHYILYLLKFIIINITSNLGIMFLLYIIFFGCAFQWILGVIMQLTFPFPLYKLPPS